MYLQNKLFKCATWAVFSVSIFAAGNASAKQQSLEFTANISTNEFIFATPLCASQQGGIGTGVGSTNLFPPNPTPGMPNAALSSSDCVTPVQEMPPINDFGPGVFTLKGAAGDSIFAQYSGRLSFDLSSVPTQTSVTLNFVSSTFQIVGGTGRYKNATGTGTITGNEVVNPADKTSKGTLVAKGSVVY
jgi:hypothetical protein